MGEMLTVTQFASEVGVNRRTVLRWIREGRINAERTPGGHWRVPERDLTGRDLTLAEFAKEAGICKRTALRWVHSGRLDAHSTPGGFMVAASEARRLGVARQGGSVRIEARNDHNPPDAAGQGRS